MSDGNIDIVEVEIRHHPNNFPNGGFIQLTSVKAHVRSRNIACE